MHRENCPRCRRPASACLCPTEPPIPVRTKIVLLMHLKEWRRQKSATGRLTCMNLKDAEIIPGVAFDDEPRVRELLADTGNWCALLYPGEGAYNLSTGAFPAAELAGKRLVVFLIDSTWSCSKTILRLSPGLLALPRLMFTPREPSKFIIKRQPRPEYLSTIEATHELLLALEAAGLDEYPDKERLLRSFFAMRDYQIERARATPNPRRRNP